MKIKQLDIKEINEIVNLIWNVQLEFNQIPICFKNDESKRQFKQFVLRKMIDELVFYGIIVEDKIVALIGYDKNHIDFLYVMKEYQKMGYGTILLRMVLDLLKEYEVVTIDSIDTAQDFYLKNGFNFEKEKVYSIGMEYRRK